MSYKTRKELYKQLSQKRGNPLITYVTSIRPNASAQMAADVIPQIIKQLDLIPRGTTTSIDFLIVSNGGDPITAIQIMNLLRERFETVNVLLPYSAFSAATILALGADRILMHPYSNLGPVDPQLTVQHADQNGIRESLQFSSEDISNYIDFIKQDVGITDQQHLVTAIEPLLKGIGAVNIGYSKRGQQLSLRLSEKMLNIHMNDAEKAKQIARSLNSSFYHHGYPVSRTEAKNIGLPVETPDLETEDLLWNIWQDFNAEMKCDYPFNPLSEMLNDPEIKRALNSYPTLNIPGGTPPEIQTQILQRLASSSSINMQQTYSTSVLIGSLESENTAFSIYNRYEIAYWRDLSLNLQTNLYYVSDGWIEENE